LPIVNTARSPPTKRPRAHFAAETPGKRPQTPVIHRGQNRPRGSIKALQSGRFHQTSARSFHGGDRRFESGWGYWRIAFGSGDLAVGVPMRCRVLGSDGSVLEAIVGSIVWVIPLIDVFVDPRRYDP
jgi:hypothetical protein